MGVGDHIRLARPAQWYKNLLIFTALFFAYELSLDGLIVTGIGFVSLCLLSSANYVFNDIIDAKVDRLHPEKKNRPLASGAVKNFSAVVYGLMLFSAAIWFADSLGRNFLLFILSIFGFTLLYSLKLKNYVFLDIILISVNFVLRAASGAVIINVKISPWLIICAFFLALFLAAGKRRADLAYLGKKAALHRTVFKEYTIEILDKIIIITSSATILSYSLYTFLKAEQGLLFTIPIVVYACFRYNLLISRGTPEARKPETALSDKPILLSVVLWGIIVLVSLYT